MLSSQSFLKKVAAAILAVAVLLGVVGYEVLRVTRTQEHNLELVTHTYSVRDAINQIVENIRTAGTSHRAYVLRGSAVNAGLKMHRHAGVKMHQ